MNNDESTYEFLGESDHDFVPSPEEWANAQSLMDEYLAKRKRRRMIFWFFVLTLIIGSGLWIGYSYMINTNNNTQNEIQSPLALNKENKSLNKDIKHKIEHSKLNVENNGLVHSSKSNGALELEKENIFHSVDKPEIIQSNDRAIELKDNSKNELKENNIGSNPVLELYKTNDKNDVGSTIARISLVSNELLLPIGIVTISGINFNGQIVEIEDVVDKLIGDNEEERQRVVLKKNTWSLRPYVELGGQLFLKSTSNETSRYGWSSLIGLDLMRNKKWYVTLSTGVAANHGEWGLTKDIYYDQSNFGVEFERWKITPKAVYNWTSKLGVGVKLGKQDLMLFAKSHYAIGSYSEVLYNRYSALEIKRKPSKPEMPKTKKYWVKDSGLKNPRWDVGISYGRKLRSNIILSSSLVYRLGHEEQLDGTILRSPDTKPTHVFPRMGLEIGLKYSFN